jgi:hypothetical protein
MNVGSGCIVLFTPRNRRRIAARAGLLISVWLAFGSGTAGAAEPADFSGVWAMVQHSRPGAPFFIPVEPPLTAEGRAVTEAFAAKFDVVTFEANGHCVEPGMPTVMWGIGGASMEIVQQPERITLLSELANQSRRIYMDGRAFPEGFPHQRAGYSIGHWENDTLVIETRLITECMRRVGRTAIRCALSSAGRWWMRRRSRSSACGAIGRRRRSKAKCSSTR